MRSIAIPVADRSECGFALQVAFNLGKALQSDVVGYHMRPRNVDMQNADVDLAGLWAVGGLTPAAWPMSSEKDAQEKSIKAKNLFSSVAEEHAYELSASHGTASKPKAIYREMEGTPDQVIPVYGPANDMMVVSRPAKKGAIKAWMVMMTALLDSTAPVLILPQKKVTVDSTGQRNTTPASSL